MTMTITKIMTKKATMVMSATIMASIMSHTIVMFLKKRLHHLVMIQIMRRKL